MLVHPVNHRPRMAGVSNYGVWNRLWVGLVDVFGVRWLQHRAKRIVIREINGLLSGWICLLPGWNGPEFILLAGNSLAILGR